VLSTGQKHLQDPSGAQKSCLQDLCGAKGGYWGSPPILLPNEIVNNMKHCLHLHNSIAVYKKKNKDTRYKKQEARSKKQLTLQRHRENGVQN
jgi:hypothetical protein